MCVTIVTCRDMQVTNNRERASVTMQRMVAWAKLHKQPILRWKNKLHSSDWSTKYTAEQKRHLFATESQLYEYFVRGMPAVVNCNIRPELGIANGCQCVYEQLVLPFGLDRMKRVTLQMQMEYAQPGEIIDLDFTPEYVMVRIDIDVAEEKFPEQWGAYFSDDLKSVVVPIPKTEFPVSAKESEAIQIYPDAEMGIRSGRIGYTGFCVEPFLAVTILKIQGLTVKKYGSYELAYALA